jgi:hypothetical protein
MISHQRTILGRLVPLILSLAIAFASTPLLGASPPGQQDQSKYTAGGQLKKPSTFSGLPVIGEFQGQPESPADHERRQIREKRYSSLSLRKKPIVDPGRLVDGQLETSDITFIDTVVTGPSTDPRGIPTSVSTAVVVGTILGGKCFVSSDRNFVYTDYQMRVDQVLKQDPTTSLSVGDQVVASKPGGAVHFPSGHITNFLYPGHGLPAIGSQYVLFLWRSIPSLPEYEIAFQSGYELKNGRVYPLDDANLQYEDMSAPVFLALVQKAIAAAQPDVRPLVSKAIAS